MTKITKPRKEFLARGTGQQLFTKDEFDEALYSALLDIEADAEKAKYRAVLAERQACADIAKSAGNEDLAKLILNRTDLKSR